jgi:hypothetical protein
MVHSHFLDKVHYEALSYMWGSEDCPLQIELNGTTIEAKNNLWRALKHIYQTDSVRILWIDALCINQNDINERNHQVSQMGRIYESAIGVLAWLGLSDDSSSLAMKCLFEFGLRFKGLRKMNQKDLSREPGFLWINGDEITAISLFCTREYWSRLWII